MRELPHKLLAAGVLFRTEDGRVLLVEPSYKTNWEIRGGIVGAGEVAGVNFPDGEIVSAGLYTLEEARELVKPWMAARLAAAVQAVADGTTALCEYGERVA